MATNITRLIDLDPYDPETDNTPAEEIQTILDHSSWPRPKRFVHNLANNFYDWAEASLATLLALLGISESKWNEMKAFDPNTKVDKVTGYGLSKNDFTDLLKAKLEALENMQTVFTIEVPTGDISERAAGATGGDGTTGWTYAAAANPNDLQITHNLGRKFACVTVSYLDGIEQVLLMGNLGYTGVSAPSDDILVIKGLSTKAFPLVINLIFA